ncbi:MAG: hypothetical protein GC165_07460 [Armatimonadetes bacterium]|nr:hypothetical protein [Armatimonadota bacterium]MBS1727378.1 hypothetical protein [Armatimonadota bacterium]
MSYTLSPRQVSMFTELVSILEPNEGGGISYTGKTYSVVETDIRMMYWPTDNFDTHQDATQLKETNIFTSDRWHAHSSQTNIKSDNVIYVQTGVRAPTGSFHTMSGAAKPLARRALTQQVYTAPALDIDPSQITSGVLP